MFIVCILYVLNVNAQERLISFSGGAPLNTAAPSQLMCREPGGGLLLVGRDRWTNKGPPMMNICELAQDTNVFFNIQTELIF